MFAPGIRRYLIVYDYSSQTANRTLHNCMIVLCNLYFWYTRGTFAYTHWPLNCSLFLVMMSQCSYVPTLFEIRGCKTLDSKVWVCIWVVKSRWVSVVEFHFSFWPRINCSQMKLPDFEYPSSDSSSKSANFGLSKWIFYVKNHPNLSKKKIHWRISI